MADNGFTAVWRPGGGVQWWRVAMTVQQLEDQDTAYFPQGLRLQSVSTRGGRFAAVWRPGEGTQWWRAGMTVQQLEDQDRIYFGQGLRIAALAVDGGAFTAVWRPGSGTQWWRAGLTAQQLKEQDDVYFPQGLRLTALAAENERFTAVWRPGGGAQYWRSGLTGPDFEAQDQAFFAQGLRMTTVSVDGDRYAAVWQSGDGSQWVSHGRDIVDLETEDGLHFAQDMRLQVVAMQQHCAGAYRYPWRGGDTHSVTQGNNNTAPGGSHTGVQAYAFDFDLPQGTQVHAARAGTVEWVQDGQTTHYDATKPTSPTDPTNVPIPLGSTLNWGNTIRIRHTGGFTSWYFHLQAGSMLVRAGDTVAAGQPIALSGFTGRASGPHLHFQVQADSLDWGQTVPLSFGDNAEVPNTGDKATSDNAG